MSEKRFDFPYCVNTDDCLVCKYVQKHYDDEVGFTGADCLKGHSIYPKSCEDFEIKFYWKIIRKLKRCFGSY